MYSPMLQRHIALARVPLDRSAPGSRVKLELAVNHRYEYFDAHVDPAAALQPRAKDRLTWRRRRRRAATRRRPSRDRRRRRAAATSNGRPDLRRDRHRRRPQRADERRLPREGRPADARSSSGATSSAARRSPRSSGPGFWFTTFSYALSLLRPDIIHDLELTKHGFMPILMPSTFCPMENGDYLLLGQDHGENLQEIARHIAARRRRVRRVQPRRQQGLPGDQAAARPGPAGHLQRRPRGAHRARRARVALPEARQEGPPRRGPAADRLAPRTSSTTTSSRTSSRATSPRSSIIGTKVGPYSQGSGLVLLYHILGEHDGEFGAWAFHKQGNGGFTKVLARAAAVVRRRDHARVAGRARHHRATAGRPASRSPTAPSSTRRSSSRRSTRAGRSSSSSTRASCRPTSSTTIERFRFQGTSAKVNFALDGVAALPGARRPDRPVPRLHEHRAVDGVPRARLRRREVRLVLEAAVPRLRDPVDGRPGHGAARQGAS